MIALFLSLALAAAPVKEAPKSDAPALVGKWVAVPATEGGHTDLPPDGTGFAFNKDGRCRVTIGGQKPEDRLYLASPNKSPAELDISEPGPEGERPIRGIYKLDGDTLVVCLGLDGSRPKGFGPSDGGLRITLKRVRPD